MRRLTEGSPVERETILLTLVTQQTNLQEKENIKTSVHRVGLFCYMREINHEIYVKCRHSTRNVGNWVYFTRFHMTILLFVGHSVKQVVVDSIQHSVPPEFDGK